MNIKIAIDAGHGSNTGGKRTAPFNKAVDIDGDGKIDVKKGTQYREHYANVGVCVELDKALKRCGFATFKTGWDDTDSTDDADTLLSTRQKAIKAAGCKASVSIHFDASGTGATFNSASGFTVLIHNSNAGDSANLGGYVARELAKGTIQKNRGVKTQTLAMCNTATLGTQASILCELAFMTNEREAQELMANKEFWIECAEEIAQGICNYFNVKYVAQKTEESNAETNNTPSKNNGTQSTDSKSFKVKVIAKTLNIRKGPSVNHQATGTVIKGEVYTIIEKSGNWGRLKSGAGWICITSSYVQNV